MSYKSYGRGHWKESSQVNVKTFLIPVKTATVLIQDLKDPEFGGFGTWKSNGALVKFYLTTWGGTTSWTWRGKQHRIWQE